MIADQQNGLAVELRVRTEGQIKTLSFTTQTQSVFDGKNLFFKTVLCRYPGSNGSPAPDGKRYRASRE